MRLFALSLLLAFSLGISAEDAVSSLLIKLNNGQTVTIQLDQLPVVVFDKEKLQIATTEAQFEYAYADVAGFDFDEKTTGIDQLNANQTRLRSLGNGEWAIDGGGSISIFDLTGKRYDANVRNVGGSAIISLSSMPAGVYVVRMSNQSFKIVKP